MTHSRLAICIALSLAGYSTSFCSDNTEAEKAKELVQAALHAEVSGSIEDRNKMLSKAREIYKAEPSAHWQSGKIRIGKEWKSYTEAVEQSKKSKYLEEYRTLRDQSQPNIDSQLFLADYCRRHGLKDQAVAHWSAIIELDPSNQEARRQLGYTWTDGRWVRMTDRDKEIAGTAKVAVTLQERLPELKKVAADLQAGKLTSDQAVDQISRDADANCIPAWELALSTAHDKGAAVVVEALTRLSAPEASLSLARHAIWAKDPEVQSAAKTALRDRDPNSFIPAMLSELQGPWVASRGIAYDASGRLVIRYALMADGQDKQTLRVLDDIYFLSGNILQASTRASNTSGTSISLSERQRQEENAMIKKHNDQIMDVLTSVTGEESLESPQDWWQWWDEKNEVYSTREKPIFSSYAYRTAEINAPITFRRPSSTSETRTERKKDCLAGGTPVLTQRGRIAIERVRIGDLVIAKNAQTGEVRFCPVLSTTIRDPEQLIRVTLDGDPNQSEQVIRASGGHPFWVSGKGWIRARELEVGMRLHGLEQYSEVKNVQVEEKPTRTYNLIVDSFHTYFVGQAGIMSHDNSVLEPVRCSVPGLQP